MVETADGSGHFAEVVLRPQARIVESEHIDRTRILHERAHGMCFIANSVNFEARCEPIVSAAGE